MNAEFLWRVLRISRPLMWPVVALAYLLGVVASHGPLGGFQLLEVFLLALPGSIYAFGLNDIYDRETDRFSHRKQEAIWGAVLSVREVQWLKPLVLAMGLLVLGAALWSGIAAHILATAGFLLFAYWYSTPPVRLKERPGLDSLSNAIYLLGPFAMGYSLTGGYGFLYLGFVLFSLIFSGLHALAAIMDIETDRRAGIRTIATSLGGRRTAGFAFLAFAVNLPFAWAIMPSAAIVLGLLALLALGVLIRPSPRAARDAGALLLLLLVLWLVYLAIGLAAGWEHIDISGLP